MKREHDMGCDIHLYVEYLRPAWSDYRSFFGRLRLARFYPLFAALGVRARAQSPDDVKHELRGLPLALGDESRLDSSLYVTDDGSKSNTSCTRQFAEKCVAEGLSIWEKGFDSDQAYITHPDWHSHSWLTYEEFRRALQPFVNREGLQEYRALVAAMKQLVDEGFEVRVVFWFDN